MTLHNPVFAATQHATGVWKPVQSALVNPQNPVPAPVQQGNGLETSVQAALSVFSQNPVPAPVQQLSGAAPVVQLASEGGVFTLNLKSTVQKVGLFAGISSEGTGGGPGVAMGSMNVNSWSALGGWGSCVAVQVTSPGPGGAVQVVVMSSANVTLGLSGLGAHVVSTPMIGRNLLQSSPARKLKT